MVLRMCHRLCDFVRTIDLNYNCTACVSILSHSQNYKQGFDFYNFDWDCTVVHGDSLAGGVGDRRVLVNFRIRSPLSDIQEIMSLRQPSQSNYRDSCSRAATPCRASLCSLQPHRPSQPGRRADAAHARAVALAGRLCAVSVE